MLTVLHADLTKKSIMNIITKNKIKDLHKDHRNSDLNINKDHDRDLKNIEQTALNGGLSKDHNSTQEPDLSCNKSHDLNSHSRNDNEKDHVYDLKNTEQTALNGGLLKIMALLKSQIFHATKVTILNLILVKRMKKIMATILKTSNKPL